MKSIPGAMKTRNLIFKILEKHTRDSKYSDFGSILMDLGIDGAAFCIGFDMVFVKKRFVKRLDQKKTSKRPQRECKDFLRLHFGGSKSSKKRWSVVQK